MMASSSFETDTLTITREEAALRGLSRFYTGKKCKAGHAAERYVSNRQCVECNAEKARQREARKCATDVRYRIYRNVQRRSGQALKGVYGPVQAIGCDAVQLTQHIANKRTKGMTWEKYGQWEIDHTIPLSAANSNEELIELCHYTNLQPMWKRENQVKGGA
ncbi:hypothetical protein MXMO3_00026 [Maritalea myrionectae]|uniref:HNH nuclease domain-containing protein n=1 Tax=Maritalea myrionectae TaxID=454601 RepID=A0A2R4M9H9_9HYPH|nr:hypothetical protein [Maritalea myrionectae]AVX02574.1 hypothetical protein MXMO3_00026 [Maritalea myrionectae]